MFNNTVWLGMKTINGKVKPIRERFGTRETEDGCVDYYSRYEFSKITADAIALNVPIQEPTDTPVITSCFIHDCRQVAEYIVNIAKFFGVSTDQIVMTKYIRAGKATQKQLDNAIRPYVAEKLKQEKQEYVVVDVSPLGEETGRSYISFPSGFRYER